MEPSRVWVTLHYILYSHIGRTSQDVKRQNIWDFYPLYFGFSWPFTFDYFDENYLVFKASRGESYYAMWNLILRPSSQILNQVKKKLFQFERNGILEKLNQKIKKVWILLLSECKVFFFIIFLHIMTRLYLYVQIKSLKRLQMWLNNSQCGHREGQKFPIVWWDNHLGKFSLMLYIRLTFWLFGTQ